MGIIFNGCDMGTMEEAESALAEKARVYRDHRQPVVASAAQIKAHNAREHEARFQCANAALHWLWHREHALQAATAEDGRHKDDAGKVTEARAIEFGEYLAKAAERYQGAMNVYAKARITNDAELDFEPLNEAYRALNSAIYEFRKRKDRCVALQAALAPTEGER